MNSIQILIRCPEGLSEVLPDELENAEFLVEDIVSQVLMELFRTVIVDTIIIRIFPSKQEYEDTLP